MVDFEFNERGRQYPLEMISIGIRAEDGRRFYAVSCDFDEDECNDWVKQNVLPNVWAPLPPDVIFVRQDLRVSTIALMVQEFVQNGGWNPSTGANPPEFWGYYADYDWVIFCQMFGTMLDLPKGWPMYCRDLKQLCDSLGNPKLPKQVRTEHHSLHDACWNETIYQFLMDYTPPTKVKTSRKR